MKKIFSDFGGIIKSLFSDERGCWSSKRFVGIVSALCILWVFVTGRNSPEALVDAVVVLSVAGLGLTTIDKFSLKKSE